MRRYASDWVTLGKDLEYSKELDLYYYKGRIYDERSARHNGIVGEGAQLRRLIKGQ